MQPGSSEDQRHGDGTDWLYERKCPQCGEKFCMPNKDLWAYKDSGDRPLCSWHCLREREKNEAVAALEKKCKTKRIQLNEAQKKWIMEMIKQGVTTDEIMRRLSVSSQVVWYYRQKTKKKG